MSQLFSVTETPHDAFGVLAILDIGGQSQRRFTRQEAIIVSHALNAVAKGTSAERQIYMSPIASDHDFEAQVNETGIVVISDGCIGIQLDWNNAGALSKLLEAFGSGD
jgi:hypothetical protein